MKFVATAASDYVHRAAAVAPVFGIGGGGGDTEFLDRVVHLEWDRLVRRGSNVVRAVEQEVVRGWALAIHAERSAAEIGALLGIMHVRSQESQNQEVSVVERQGAKLFAGDHARDGGGDGLVADAL